MGPGRSSIKQSMISRQLSSAKSGFTIVELLIVIVVIAILAALSYVGYTSVSARAAEATVQSDVTNASKKLKTLGVDTGSYPSSLPSEIKASGDNTIHYAQTGSGTGYCLTVTSAKSNVKAYYASDTQSTTQGNCPGHPSGGGGGGGGGSIADDSPIQDVTSAQCQALPVYDGTNAAAVKTVTDARGGTTRTYEIAKLADGKCWMLTNLKLGSTSGPITLTPTDSNVASNFTLPQLTTGGAKEHDDPRVYGPVPGDTGSGATNYGYLYNWPAATAGATRTTNPAGSGNAANSICPKGWLLPTGSSASSDFGQLDQIFGGTGNYASGGPSPGKWRYTGPFKGAFAGGWSGSFYDRSAYGYWWSSSALPSTTDYTFGARVAPGLVYPGDGGSPRGNGHAVRCLLQ